jgi:DNA polymerase-1
MKICVFDLETNGLLNEVTKVHVMAVRCLSTGKLRVFREHQIAEGLSYLDQFDLLVGHNIIKYDIPVLTKLFGYVRHWSHLRDTLVLSRLVWGDIIQHDLKTVKDKKFFPGKYMGSHSLAAWGFRLGNNKGEYAGDPAIADPVRREAEKWLRWNQAMEDYCVQDLSSTQTLWERLLNAGWAAESINLETQTASILARQERYGILFDQVKAVELYGTLVQRRMTIERDLQKVFLPRMLRDGKTFIPKADNKRFGYVAGAEFQKLKLTEFNPGSRDHVAIWLKALRGWKPTEFTADGGVKVDDEIMGKLPYPECVPLKEYFTVTKRIGQIAEGKQAWLTSIGPDGRIHGSVNTGGTVTGRMSHSSPNLGQVPAAYSPYGPECRALFIVPPGKSLVGCDADALELRDLAGYMAYYDNGIYIEAVLNGSKKDGTDTHSMNARALGLDPTAIYFDGESGRDIAKTWFYAFIYGAGDEKLGFILLRKRGPKAVTRGKKARADFLYNLPAMGELVKAVKAKAKASKWLKGLDGRRIPVRSDHAALNTLLQSAGAVQMKRALCILDDDLQSIGLVPGLHYEFVANVHDEWQIEVNDDLVETIGPMAANAIRKAGEYYNFRCPLAGDWKHGKSWYDTH